MIEFGIAFMCAIWAIVFAAAIHSLWRRVSGRDAEDASDYWPE